MTSEFLVIDGAKALALPCRFGQSLTVQQLPKQRIRWKALDVHGDIWYEQEFIWSDNGLIPQKNLPQSASIDQRLQQIFKALKQENSELFTNKGFAFTTHLKFPQNWGLGSSSTLIANLAQWSGINPYVLLQKTFGGSAYDIACAYHNSPILYQRAQALSPIVEEVNFDPVFKDRLFFVHRNQKQNTRTIVQHYKTLNPSAKKEWINKFSKLTIDLLHCQELAEFETLINIHEARLSKILQLPPVKEEQFPDYPGTLKSLGAWGGDFILATGGASEKEYFSNKGYSSILDYTEMILPPSKSD